MAAAQLTGRIDFSSITRARCAASAYCPARDPTGAQLKLRSAVPAMLRKLRAAGCTHVMAMHQDRLARGGLAALCRLARELGLQLYVAFGPDRQITRLA